MLQRLTLICTIAAWLAALPSLAAPAPAMKCLYFEQQNKFIGPSRTYASDKAVKIASVDKTWIEIARAPKWDLYLLSPTTHLYFRWELSKWTGHPLMSMGTRIKTEGKAVRTNEVKKIAGHSCVKYVASVKGAGRSEIESEQYWVCTDKHLPRQIIYIMCTNVGIPELEGIPLTVNADLHDEDSKVVMNTTCAHLASVSDNFFNIPPDYKLAKSPSEVTMGGMNDIFKDMLE